MENNLKDWFSRIRIPRRWRNILVFLFSIFFILYGCTSTSATDINDASILSTSSVVETKKENDQRNQATFPSQNMASEVVILSTTKDLSDDNNSNSILKENTDFSPSINTSLPLDNQTPTIEPNKQVRGAFVEYEETEHSNVEDSLLEENFSLNHIFPVGETKKENYQIDQSSSPSQSIFTEAVALSVTEDLSEEKTPNSIHRSYSTLKDSVESSPSFKTSLPRDTQATTIDSITQVSGSIYVEYEENEHPSSESSSLYEETLSLHPSFSSDQFHGTRASGDESDITKIETLDNLEPHEIGSDSHATVVISQVDDGKSMYDPGFSHKINESGLIQSSVAVTGEETAYVRPQALDKSTRESNNDTSLSTVITFIPSKDKENHQLPLSREAPTFSLPPAANTESSLKAPMAVLDTIDYRNERSISLMNVMAPLPSNDQVAPDAIESSSQETPNITLEKPIHSLDDAVPFLFLGVIFMLILLGVFSRKKKRKKYINKPLYRESVAAGMGVQLNSMSKSNEYKSVPDNRTFEDQEPMYSVHIEGDERSMPSYSIPKPPQKLTTGFGAVQWVSAGKAIEVNGFQIDKGMLYVGSKVNGTTDPSFINTKLPVSAFTDYSTPTMGYWPSYSQISSYARGAYLAWLADGRKDPKADPGYVFLFFYGLERRVLVDYQEIGIDDAELLQIKSEINRLFSIYGSKSNSIKGYFSNFLSLLLLLERRNTKLYDWPIPENLKGYDLPFYLKAYLGQCAVDGKPLPAQAAYQWVFHDPTVSKRTPALRCETELQKLFLIRYVEAYGDGLQLPLNKTKLKISYHAASSHLYGFSLDVDVYKNLPDVTVLTSIRNKLKKIFDSCSDELDRYSRYLGKTGKELGNKNSIALLPTELIVELKKDTLQVIYDELLPNESMPTLVSLLLKEILDEEMPTRDAICALARVLELSGISMEPDVLAYTYELKNENKVLLFSNSELAPKERDNSTYLLNVLMIELSYAVAQADGIVDDKEVKAIQQYVDSLQQVSPYHILRLRKHLEFLQHTTVNDLSMRKKLKSIATTDLSILLASVNNIVLADGIIDHAEIQFLEKLYRYLGLDYSQLYHQRHSPKAYGFTQTEDSDRPLDYERVASLKIESAEVSSILSEIFLSDEEDYLLDEHPITGEEEENPLGLDDEQMKFLDGLVAKTSWSREDLQEMAEKYGIMLDGTLEHVNENSLELFGIPVTEGDDPIEILEEFWGRTIWQ